MRTIMMSGLLLAAMSGCATVGGGVNTSNHGIWYQDCGVSRPIPGATATFKGTLTSPNSAVATDEQQPPKSSNVKGTLRVIMPHPDTCNSVAMWATSPDGDCTKSGDCKQGEYCKAGTCVPKKAK